MDMDNPPPKKTGVRIEKWEYSDPGGVPHPDKVEILAKIESDGRPKMWTSRFTGSGSSVVPRLGQREFGTKNSLCIVGERTALRVEGAMNLNLS